MDYAQQQAALSKRIAQEEKQRRESAANHKGPCVPWRGAGGEIGRCIYCGKMPDAITRHYDDRANSGQSALTAHR